MRFFLLILFSSIIYSSLFGQCPGRDTLLKRIINLRNSSTINKSEQLEGLLQYDKRVKKCLGTNDSVYTFLLLSIGVSYYKLADYVHAIRYTKQAINIIHANAFNPAIIKGNLIKYYYYLSIYYDSLKLVSQKNEAIDSCISNEMQAKSDYHYASLVLQDNVRDLYNKGDYNLCIDRSTLGETLIHKFYKYADSMSHIFFFIYYKASALRSSGHYDEEEQFLQNKKSEFLKVKDKDYRGAIYNLFGYLYESKGEYKKAIAYFKKAVYYDMFSSKKQITAEVLTKIGTIYSEKLGENKLAYQYYNKALVHARYKVLANANASDSFYILGNIANVYTKIKLFDSAYYFFQKAFDKIKPGINEADLALHIEDYVLANTAAYVVKLVLDKADAYLEQYIYERNTQALRRALFIYRAADRLLNGIKLEQAELESKLYWRSYARHLYEHAIKASYFENNPDEAFYFFEKSRAVLLNDELNEQSKISDDDILKQAQLKKKIIILQRERDITNVSSSQYIEIQNGLIANQLELNKLEQAIKKNNPVYYQSFFDTTFISLKIVKKNLLKEQQLLELFEGDSAVYILLISFEHTYFNKVNKNDFDGTVKKYTAYISNPLLLNKEFNIYTQTANHLCQLIFYSHQLQAGRLIISPDGLYFPFEALITNMQPLTYFLEDHAVSYTYSARYLLNNFILNSSSITYSFFGIAPVYYSNGLAALTGSDQSLQRMHNYFSNATSLVVSNATKNNFLKEYYKYKIIQLYTHATDSGYAGEPMIYFSDSTLSLSDLFYENKPATNLIVLSACETAGGKLYNGEGVFSFNRGFAALGIPSSISNLWKVDNQSTYRLTELFYKYMTDGIPLDIALQKAKKEFKTSAIGENKLPYYWAAPILVGKTDKIVLQKSSSWKWIAALAVLMLLFFGGLIIKRKLHAVQSKS